MTGGDYDTDGEIPQAEQLDPPDTHQEIKVIKEDSTGILSMLL